VEVILVKGGEIDFIVAGTGKREKTIVLPSGYGLAHYIGNVEGDDSGKNLGKCSLYFGPIRTTQERVEELPREVAKYFGNDYDAKIAHIDIPNGRWDSHSHITEIVYYRPGRYAEDWRHEFSKPVTLFKQGRWWKLKLPKDCSVTWKGIERP
jgi:hypothetical protein